VQPVRHLVENQLALRTHGPRDDIGLGVCLGLLGREGAGIHQLLHQAVVMGNAMQRALPQQIDSAIPGPKGCEMLAAHQQHNDGGGDDASPFTGRRLGLQFRVHGSDPQPHLGEHFRRGQPRRNIAHGIGDGGTREIARAMPARPIRDDPEAEIGPVHQIVLVARTDGTGMRGRAGGEGLTHAVGPSSN